MESYNKFILLNGSTLTEEQKKIVESRMEHRAKELFYVNVVYTPNCGCKIKQDVRLDRYPMSEKIMTTCPSCKKGCLMEISDPIKFYTKYNDKEFFKEDLKNYDIVDSWQNEFILNYLEENEYRH